MLSIWTMNRKQNHQISKAEEDPKLQTRMKTMIITRRKLMDLVTMPTSKNTQQTTIIRRRDF